LIPKTGIAIVSVVNVVSRQTLRAFWLRHPRAEGPLRAWYALAWAAEWKDPQDVRAQFNRVDFVGDNRIIFDIGGNNYRLVVRISYRFKQVLIKFVGTHADYDRIDVETI
jgi:mRNA interferase HigB